MPGDIFDDTAGPGAHLAEGTRRIIEIAYRRWLGFLSAEYPDDLRRPPADRITPARVRAFAERLETEVRQTTVAHGIANLHYAARLIDPTAGLAMVEGGRRPPRRPRHIGSTGSTGLYLPCAPSTSASS